MQNRSYYQLCRDYGRNAIENNHVLNRQGERPGKIIARPVDKRENYVKRCVAIPGDTLQVVRGKLIINNKDAFSPPRMQHKYHVKTGGTGFNKKLLLNIDITEDVYSISNNDYIVTLNDSNIEDLRKFANVIEITPIISPESQYNNRTFPHSTDYLWNEDNYGPLVIPKKGTTVPLTLKSLPIYKRVINQYEQNDLKVEGDKRGYFFFQAEDGIRDKGM